MSAYSEALAAWKLTEEGIDCADICTLDDAPNSAELQKYLDNRLAAAFAAAWDIHAGLVDAVLNSHLRATKTILGHSKR